MQQKATMPTVQRSNSAKTIPKSQTLTAVEVDFVEARLGNAAAYLTMTVTLRDQPHTLKAVVGDWSWFADCRVDGRTAMVWNASP
jgi:hypothetical protein